MTKEATKILKREAANDPVAVLISDIHFNLSTLEEATAALQAALALAYELRVPLVVAGDLIDSKANLRAEVVNRLIDIFTAASAVVVYVIVGNHDMLSEKGEDNSLHFLAHLVSVVRYCTFIESVGSWLIPYHNSVEKLKATLSEIPAGSRLIMHQGVQTAYMGHYVQDTTSLPKEAFADFRVISGHYHKAQDIKCGRPRRGAVGLFSYIGNPFTLNFGEANDGPKGFQVLHHDGTLEQRVLPIRRHVVLEWKVGDSYDVPMNHLERDLIWVKLSGLRSELSGITKAEIGRRLHIRQSYKLDLIPIEADAPANPTTGLTSEAVFDNLIDNVADTAGHKTFLKQLWRDII